MKIDISKVRVEKVKEIFGDIDEDKISNSLDKILKLTLLNDEEKIKETLNDFDSITKRIFKGILEILVYEDEDKNNILYHAINFHKVFELKRIVLGNFFNKYNEIVGKKISIKSIDDKICEEFIAMMFYLESNYNGISLIVSESEQTQKAITLFFEGWMHRSSPELLKLWPNDYDKLKSMYKGYFYEP